MRLLTLNNAHASTHSFSSRRSVPAMCWVRGINPDCATWHIVIRYANAIKLSFFGHFSSNSTSMVAVQLCRASKARTLARLHSLTVTRSIHPDSTPNLSTHDRLSSLSLSYSFITFPKGSSTNISLTCATISIASSLPLSSSLSTPPSPLSPALMLYNSSLVLKSGENRLRSHWVDWMDLQHCLTHRQTFRPCIWSSSSPTKYCQ